MAMNFTLASALEHGSKLPMTLKHFDAVELPLEGCAGAVRIMVAWWCAWLAQEMDDFALCALVPVSDLLAFEQGKTLPC